MNAQVYDNIYTHTCTYRIHDRWAWTTQLLTSMGQWSVVTGALECI